MSGIVDIIGGAIIVVGLFFMSVAAIGFVRLPDLFSRLHVTGILDSLGAPLVLLGAAIWVGPTLTAGKLFLAIIFLYLTSPLVGHLLSRAAIEAGIRPRVVEDQSEPGDFSIREVNRADERAEGLAESSEPNEQGGDA